MSAALEVAIRRALAPFELDVAFAIGRETVALVGPSGCGKSATLGAIAGVASPDAGRIELDGDAVYDSAARVDLPPERRGIGYVPQRYALFPHLRVRENVAFGIARLPHAERAERVARAVELLRIGDLLAAWPATLSGGERQRVALARALVTRPRALLLDEPLAALDVESRSRIRLELRALLERLGTPALVVTHDFEDARVLGDRIAVMRAGRVAQIGTARELAYHPANAFVARFAGTNLASVTLGGRTRDAAFDPWRAELSRDPRAGPLAWRGRVVDVARLGAATRVRVEGDAALTVDVPESVGSAGYRAGEPVWITVAPEHLRFIAPPP